MKLPESQLSAWLILGAVATFAFSSGCESTTASGRVDHALDDPAATVAAAGGQMEIHVNFANADIGDEDLATLPLPTAITSIDLTGTKITNDGLRHLQRLTKLEKLYIADTEIDDEGLEHLMALERLWLISADHSKISRQGQLKLIKHLAPRAQAHAIKPHPNHDAARQ